MHDQLPDGRNYRLFSSLDDFKREGLDIETGFAITAIRVIRCLNQLIEWRGKPEAIHCDHGPEFLNHDFTYWSKKHSILIEYIQPGKPQQNAYVEQYNCTACYSWDSKHLFDTLKEIQHYSTKWLWFHNH